MEKLQKEEDLDEDLDTLREYGFNIDELITMLKEDEEDDDKE